jgi:hypothetical protein
VLRYLPANLTRPEIARPLPVLLNTVNGFSPGWRQGWARRQQRDRLWMDYHRRKAARPGEPVGHECGRR